MVNLDRTLDMLVQHVQVRTLKLKAVKRESVENAISAAVLSIGTRQQLIGFQLCRYYIYLRRQLNNSRGRVKGKNRWWATEGEYFIQGKNKKKKKKRQGEGDVWKVFFLFISHILTSKAEGGRGGWQEGGGRWGVPGILCYWLRRGTWPPGFIS